MFFVGKEYETLQAVKISADSARAVAATRHVIPKGLQNRRLSCGTCFLREALVEPGSS
jgi:hypothetical protein